LTRLPVSTFVLILALVLAILALAIPAAATAQAAPRNVLVTLAPLGANTKLELVALIVDADIADGGDHTRLSGQLTFKVHNTDRLTATDSLVGFPSWGGGAQEFDTKALGQFAISLNGDPVQADWQNAPIKLGNETRAIRWLAFPLHLAEDERATIQVAFKQDLGDAVLPSAIFAQAPAILWKGYVGSARFTFRMPTLTTPEQLRSISPAASTFDGKTVNWLFDTFNPDVPIVVQMIRPRLWHDIVQARAEVGRGDAKAAIMLGGLYAQLARVSQNASDFSLALAAYQKAGDLDASSAEGPLAAARLYEAQLKGDFGKVSDENTSRAAALGQWQRALKVSPGNAEAKDAAAQNALILAQAARRSGGYGAALTWLAAARNANSSKVPSTLLDSEMRADRAGLALQQIDSARFSEVLQQVQAGAFGPELRGDLSSSLAHFSSVQVSINVAAGRETVSARFVPFPAPSPELEQALNEWPTATSSRPDAKGQLEVDGDVYVLNLNLPATPLRAADLPALPETLLLREALTPAGLQTAHTDSLFTATDSFIAHFALTESQRAAQGKVDDVERALKALATPAQDETQELVRRLRVRLLETYRVAWQNLLSGSNVRVVWSGEAIRSEQWDLRPGDVQTLQAQRTTYQTWTMVAVGTLALGLLVLLIAGVIFLWRRLRPAAPAATVN
jgi:tetratricopeptide (TPR) repeat protein